MVLLKTVSVKRLAITSRTGGKKCISAIIVAVYQICKEMDDDDWMGGSNDQDKSYEAMKSYFQKREEEAVST